MVAAAGVERGSAIPGSSHRRRSCCIVARRLGAGVRCVGAGREKPIIVRSCRSARPHLQSIRSSRLDMAASGLAPLSRLPCSPGALRPTRRRAQFLTLLAEPSLVLRRDRPPANAADSGAREPLLPSFRGALVVVPHDAPPLASSTYSSCACVSRGSARHSGQPHAVRFSPWSIWPTCAHQMVLPCLLLRSLHSRHVPQQASRLRAGKWSSWITVGLR